MRGFRIWVAWLRLVAILLVCFGVLMVMLNASILFQPFNDGIDPSFWVDSALPGPAVRFRTWVYAAWGATIAGWGLTLLLIIQNAFSKQERWAWYSISLGLALWYVLDTGVSAYFGVGFNVAFNSLILLVCAIPLAASFRIFHPGT